MPRSQKAISLGLYASETEEAGAFRQRYLAWASGLTTIGRAVFEPGWVWSSHVKPFAGTVSCQAAHTRVVMQGRMVVRMDDGTEAEAGPGDVVYIAPGHDAWIVGDETCIMFDVTGMPNYAKSG